MKNKIRTRNQAAAAPGWAARNRMRIPVLLLSCLVAALFSAGAFAQQPGQRCPFCPPTHQNQLGNCETPGAGPDCPGETNPIGGGYCLLRCEPGKVQDPADPHRCRTASAAVCAEFGLVFRPGENRCESECAPGEEANPFAAGECRVAFACPGGLDETADGVCGCGPAQVEIGGECLPASAQNCESAGKIFANGACKIPSAANCTAAGMLYLPGQGTCGDQCPPDFESVGGECLDRCRERLPDRSDGSPLPTPTAGSVCEMDRSHGAYSINLPAAHAVTLANGDPLLGRGVTVAVAEPGFVHWREGGGGGGGPGDPNAPISSDGGPPSASATVRTHSELPSIRVFGYSPDDERFLAEGTPDEAEHALAVLGVMAAKKDGVGVVGVAPEADYLFHDTRGTRFSVVLENLTDAGAFIINNSWGPALPLSPMQFRQNDQNGNLDLQATQNALRQILRELGFGIDVALLSQAYRFPDPADRPILVWAAGNDNGLLVEADSEWNKIKYSDGREENYYEVGTRLFFNDPEFFGGLPRYFTDLTLNNLAVVAVDEFAAGENAIVEFSARCGPDSASFCLAAPGVAGFDFRFLDANEQTATAAVFPCVARWLATDGLDFDSACNFIERLSVRKFLSARRFADGVGGGFLLAPETAEFIRTFNDLPGLEDLDGIPEGYQEGAGTSFAAPLVSGALALMKQYFMRATDCGQGDLCGLGSHDLVERILLTADKTGIYANEALYGAGLLDLENALTPQGALRLLTGRSLAEAESHLFSQSALRPGAALGDSAGRALRGRGLAAFDDLNAPFPLRADSVLLEVSSAEPLGEALRNRQGGGISPGRFSFREDGKNSAWWSLNGLGDSHFALGGGGGGDDGFWGSDGLGGNPYSALSGLGMVAGGARRFSGGVGVRAAMFGEGLGNEKRVRGVLAEFSFSPFADGWGGGGDAKWFAQAGGVRELDGLLDSSGLGVFSDLNSRTAFAGLGFAGGFSDGWRYRLGAHWGRTSAEGAWLSATDSLRSGSYAAGLERSDVFRSGDGLGFRIRQPLRVSGGLRFRVPTGRTKYGELTWSEVSGTPSGRELEWEARYRRPYEGGHWGVSAVLVSESGHRSGAKTEGRALFAFERAF